MELRRRNISLFIAAILARETRPDNRAAPRLRPQTISEGASRSRKTARTGAGAQSRTRRAFPSRLVLLRGNSGTLPMVKSRLRTRTRHELPPGSFGRSVRQRRPMIRRRTGGGRQSPGVLSRRRRRGFGGRAGGIYANCSSICRRRPGWRLPSCSISIRRARAISATSLRARPRCRWSRRSDGMHLEPRSRLRHPAECEHERLGWHAASRAAGGRARAAFAGRSFL